MLYDPHQAKNKSTSRAVQTLAWEVNVHSKVAVESVELAEYLTYIIRNEDEDWEELEELADDVAAFIDERVEDGVSQELLAVVLWKNLLAIEHNQRKKTKEVPAQRFR